MDGILNVYKEAGYTSHDVVAKLRGILKQKKIGHTGTLDPQAQGVLPVCLGKATRVCDLITDWTKEYRCVLLLGMTTDTQDLTGTVLEEKTVDCTEEQVRAVLTGFVGTGSQIPPMYSALKVNGRKLYDLARQGIEVERKPRQITIHSVQIHRIELPEVEFTVSCSKGTYIRTLCNDAGAVLGCGGCMKSLLRTRVGGFCLEDGLKLEEIARRQAEGTLSQAVVPVDSVFMDLPCLYLSPEAERLARNGNPLSDELAADCCRRQNSLNGDLFREEDILESGQLRVYSGSGEFLAVYERDVRRKQYRPRKMFL